LDRVERDIAESGDLLEETRRALEVIRLESGRALPGYTVLMSPPSQPLEPADDSSKMLAAAGVVGGAGFSLLLALGLGLSERRMRYAETLAPVEHKLPVLQVSAADDVDPDAADRLRNELQLQPLKRPRLVGKAPVIAVARGDHGETSEFARSLAESYARARMKTLLIEADLGRADDGRSLPGWSDVLVGETVSPVAAAETPGLWGLSAGTVGQLHDSAVSAPMVRAALDHYLRDFDAIIVSGGSLRDRLASQFVLSASDVGVLALRPSDSKAEILKQIDRFDTLPRNGSVAAMRNALPGDPWLAVRT
jgi:Mrp family chromosome partitioning ATPase